MDIYRQMGALSAGGNSYASSYPIQKVYTKLRVKPNILVLWPGRLLITPGTLARETIYVTRRGITAPVGWYIL